MAEVIRYVDPDATPNGNDGTTWEKAYLSLQACETGETTDLATAGNWLHIYCRSSAGTADTAVCTIGGGWGLSSTSYILVEAASTDRASISGWSDTKYRLMGGNGPVLTLAADYVRIDGLQIQMTTSDAHLESAVTISGQTSGANDIRISNCRIRASGNASYRTPCIRCVDADAVVYVWNTICEGMSAADNAGNAGIYVDNTAGMKITNCIVYGAGTGSRGINCIAGTVSVWNTAVLNHADDFVNSGTLNLVTCASDDNDDGAAVAEDGGGADWTGDFVDGSAGDWTLLSGSGLVGTGTVDPTELGLGETDIAGTTRGVAWDVGPFEYVAAGGGAVVPRLMAYYRRLRA